jgi:hypothetical protein
MDPHRMSEEPAKPPSAGRQSRRVERVPWVPADTSLWLQANGTTTADLIKLEVGIIREPHKTFLISPQCGTYLPCSIWFATLHNVELNSAVLDSVRNRVASLILKLGDLPLSMFFLRANSPSRAVKRALRTSIKR